ncbi:MAG: hypothetical protein DSZ11_04820, partial [Sulfurovum sp.]
TNLTEVAITSTSATSIEVNGSSTMTITGGEGEDTVIINGALVSNLEMSNIENLAVSGTTSLDLDNVTVDKVISLDGALTASNVEDETFVISGVATPSSPSPSLTATLKDDSGATDAISVEVLQSATAVTTALTLNNIETLNIETNVESGVTGDVEINLTTSTTGSANQSLNISGDALAKFATTAVEATTIDASGNTAGVNLLLGASDQTITGTAVDDVFDFRANADANDSVDGGAGEDTVMFDVGVATVSAETTNIEIADVKFTAATTFDASNLTDVGLIQVKGATGTLSNIATGTNIEISDDATITLGVKDASTGTADSLDVVLTKAGDQTITSLTANDIETLTLSTSDTGETTITTLDATSLTTLDFTGIDDVLKITNELNNTSGMDILLGNQSATTTAVSFTLESAENVSDTIKFGDALVGAVEITNFTAGLGDKGDNLDFSAYGVTQSDDLSITYTGAGATAYATIDITGDDNFGSIKLIGVEDGELADANFDFA